MIHRIKYGWMKVTLEASLDDDCRAPDLTFKGEDGREFAVFFAPSSTTEGTEMEVDYHDHSHLNPYEGESDYYAHHPRHSEDKEDNNDKVSQRS